MHINIGYIFYLLLLLFLDATSKPRNLNVSISETTATLSWESPVYDGGRKDVFYRVKYNYNTTTEQHYTYYSPSPPINDTTVTLTSLLSLTNYTFMVVAENGVTEEFPDQFVESDRTSSAVFVTTEDGGGEHIVHCSCVHA